MEINNSNFRGRLPYILEAISRSHFVSIDLELSGIPLKRKRQRNSFGGSSKQTLQERYEDTKKAAEQYQVLQLGLTCTEEHKEQGACELISAYRSNSQEVGKYVLRPFNFYINPVPEKKFDVERDVTFQSGGRCTRVVYSNNTNDSISRGISPQSWFPHGCSFQGGCLVLL